MGGLGAADKHADNHAFDWAWPRPRRKILDTVDAGALCRSLPKPQMVALFGT
jgi:hypothetical protein